MKEKRQVLFLAGLLGLLLCATGVLMLRLSPGGASGDEAEAKYRYVYLAPVGEEDFFIDIAKGIRAADADTGADTLLVRYDRGSEAFQNCIEDAMLADADGIIIKATAELSDTIEAAIEQNIPVIFYDTDLSGTNRTAYIGIDNYQAGAKAMEELAARMGEQGAVLLAARTLGADSQYQRVLGCQDALLNYPKMQIVDIIENGGNELLYKELLLKHLREDPSIRAILCLDGVSADVTGSILQDQQLEDNLLVAAFDLTDKTKEYLEEGIYSFVMMQDARQIGYEAVCLLNAYQQKLESQELKEIQGDGETVFLDIICVTLENLDQYSQSYEEELEWDVY